MRYKNLTNGLNISFKQPLFAIFFINVCDLINLTNHKSFLTKLFRK